MNEVAVQVIHSNCAKVVNLLVFRAIVVYSVDLRARFIGAYVNEKVDEHFKGKQGFIDNNVASECREGDVVVAGGDGKHIHDEVENLIESVVRTDDYPAEKIRTVNLLNVLLDVVYAFRHVLHLLFFLLFVQVRNIPLVAKLVNSIQSLEDLVVLRCDSIHFFNFFCLHSIDKLDFIMNAKASVVS